jgi:hypothetical protein
MAKNSNRVRKSSARTATDPIVTNEVGNYEKHPFFVKKANQVKKLIAQVGIPKVKVNKG